MYFNPIPTLNSCILDFNEPDDVIIGRIKDLGKRLDGPAPLVGPCAYYGSLASHLHADLIVLYRRSFNIWPVVDSLSPTWLDDCQLVTWGRASRAWDFAYLFGIKNPDAVVIEILPIRSRWNQPR